MSNLWVTAVNGGEPPMAVASGRQFVHQGESPLDYSDSTWLKPQRMAITDSEAGEHPKGDAYFAESHRRALSASVSRGGSRQGVSLIRPPIPGPGAPHRTGRIRPAAGHRG